MRIGLNATCLNDRPSGAKRRFVGIYSEVVKRLPESEFIIFEPSDCNVASWFKGCPNVVGVRTPLPSDQRVSRFVLGLPYWQTALRKYPLDIFEMFHLPVMPSPTGKTLLTIHDFRDLGEGHQFVAQLPFRAVLAASLKASDHVVTVSETMKAELLSHFPSARVSVIYNGLDPTDFAPCSQSELDAVRRKFELPREFILAVGHFEPRKNYHRLIEAVAQLRAMGRACNLVIVGNDSGLRQDITKQIEALSLTNSVKLMSGLTDLEVRCVYELCDLFVFPSSYEGFGIPILEAMAAKKPMVLSDLAVFKEITEGRAVYFPHADTQAMAAAIETVLSSLAERQRLVEYGTERLPAFALGKLAGQVVDLYESISKQN